MQAVTLTIQLSIRRTSLSPNFSCFLFVTDVQRLRLMERPVFNCSSPLSLFPLCASCQSPGMQHAVVYNSHAANCFFALTCATADRCGVVSIITVSMEEVASRPDWYDNCIRSSFWEPLACSGNRESPPAFVRSRLSAAAPHSSAEPCSWPNLQQHQQQQLTCFHEQERAKMQAASCKLQGLSLCVPYLSFIDLPTTVCLAA
mmetsp:Transcript_43388/g.92923  ORF Transcript_43388/g.92923 Transcript_43388/m.92923 type:complete len:202 (-) Transcript_43388:118-723(-)